MCDHTFSTDYIDRFYEQILDRALYDFVDWAPHQTASSVACNSDCETLAALQIVEPVVRTQRHRLDPLEVSDVHGWLDLAWALSRF